MKKRLISIISSLLVGSMFLAGCSNVSQEDYDSLKATHESLSADYKKAEEENSSLAAEVEKLKADMSVDAISLDSAKKEKDAIKSEYDAYKALMSPYESMAAAGLESAEKDVFGIGEPWIVNGQSSLTINSVITTSDRNPYSDKTPAQVVIIDYTYENLGYTDDIQDLYISSNAFSVIDQNGEMASTYPADTSVHATPTPVGAKCVGAQEAYGLNNESSSIKLVVDNYGSDNKRYEATFELTIQ